MWKVFLVIAFVTMLGAGGLSYVNMESAKETKKEREDRQATLASLETDLQTTKDQLNATNASIAKLGVETEELEGQLVQRQAMVTEAEAKLQGLMTQLAAAKVELDKAQEFEREFPNIKQLQQEMAQIRQQIDQLGIEITGLQNNIASNEVDRDNLMKNADQLDQLAEDQSRGIISVPFASTVKRAYTDWGFVIVQGGNEQGVVDRAQLDVMRGGQTVAKLVVVTVEPGESVAEVIPGSIAPGQRVRKGDVVRKSESRLDLSTDDDTPVIPTIEGGDAAGAGGVPEVADPFGGGGAAPDPFGGGGAMEPAPVPAEPAPAGGAEPDPFGGGAAPAPAEPDPTPAEPAPAGGAEPDPFGGGGAAPMEEAGGGAEPAPAPEPGGAEPDPFQ